MAHEVTSVSKPRRDLSRRRRVVRRRSHETFWPPCVHAARVDNLVRIDGARAAETKCDPYVLRAKGKRILEVNRAVSDVPVELALESGGGVIDVAGEQPVELALRAYEQRLFECDGDAAKVALPTHTGTDTEKLVGSFSLRGRSVYLWAVEERVGLDVGIELVARRLCADGGDNSIKVDVAPVERVRLIVDRRERTECAAADGLYRRQRKSGASAG